jgi:hypothetical protein
MKVVIDTNALMIPGAFGVDIFSELRRLGYDKFLVPRAVVSELERLQRSRGKERISANIAIDLLKECDIVDMDGEADELIIELAKKKEAAVFTNDSELKKRSPGDVIYLRNKKYLEKV